MNNRFFKKMAPIATTATLIEAVAVLGPISGKWYLRAFHSIINLYRSLWFFICKQIPFFIYTYKNDGFYTIETLCVDLKCFRTTCHTMQKRKMW
jgi:hypothetical protein